MVMFWCWKAAETEENENKEQLQKQKVSVVSKNPKRSAETLPNMLHATRSVVGPVVPQ